MNKNVLQTFKFLLNQNMLQLIIVKFWDKKQQHDNSPQSAANHNVLY